MINQVEDQNEFSGVRVSRVTPKMSHLLFADDSIIFSKVTEEECGKILHLLDLYRIASG